MNCDSKRQDLPLKPLVSMEISPVSETSIIISFMISFLCARGRFLVVPAVIANGLIALLRDNQVVVEFDIQKIAAAQNVLGKGDVVSAGRQVSRWVVMS